MTTGLSFVLAPGGLARVGRLEKKRLSLWVLTAVGPVECLQSLDRRRCGMLVDVCLHQPSPVRGWEEQSSQASLVGNLPHEHAPKILSTHGEKLVQWAEEDCRGEDAKSHSD